MPEDLLRFVEDQLSNDEVSSDDELLAHFIDNGLTPAQAWQALTYRTLYHLYSYLEGFTPIRQGEQALHFNPYSGKFEPG